ncbi:hypothetical protein C8R46DRAFT_140201 [Mycena filopes]|nr:hypothetical protein C8R46DRAFT_140201 [Mycena filopes]
MSLQQYPLDKTFLVAAWLESLMYGCFLCVFSYGVYIKFALSKGQNLHSQVMFIASVAMFILASMHVAINCFRLLRGFSEFREAPGGPVGYLGALNRWDHVFKITIWGTQSLLGDAMAVYRCWILWAKDYRFTALPFLLLLGSTVSGYTTCALFAKVDPTASVFDPSLTRWITTFYSLAVAQNIITTSLMAIRIWERERKSAHYRLQNSNFMPILRILIESASLYLFIEILLLAFYSVDYNAQYILLEIITPTVVRCFSSLLHRSHSQTKIAGGE